MRKSSEPTPGSQIKAIQPHEIDVLKLDLLQSYLNGSLILGTVVLLANLYLAVQKNLLIVAAIDLLLFGFLVFATFHKEGKPNFRAIMLSIVYSGAGIISLITIGINSIGFIHLFISVLILANFGTIRWLVTGIAINGLSMILIGLITQTQVMRPSLFSLEPNSIYYWASSVIMMLFLIYIILLPTSKTFAKIFDFVNSAHKREESLNDEKNNVSNRVHLLEEELDRRRSLMIASREIERLLSEKNNSKQIMQEAVDQIKKQFDYYFVAIYLVDEMNETAALQAATGKQGSLMLSKNHRLKIREEGIVGYVISHGEPRIVLDVKNDFIQGNSSNHPDIQSEMAIPLKIGGQVIGALDIQSEKDNAFSLEVSDALLSISDHLSMAIEITRKNESLQLSINELEKASSTFSRSSWVQHLKGSRKNLSYQYSENQLQKKESIIPEEKKVLHNGEKIVVSDDSEKDNENGTTFLVPISLRNQTLGVVRIKYTDKHIPKEFEEVIGKITERMAVAIENARLLEEIQDRADRERVIGRIANKVRSARDIDSILQTTAVELGRTLGVDEICVQLKTREID